MRYSGKGRRKHKKFQKKTKQIYTVKCYAVNRDRIRPKSKHAA